MTTIDMSGQQCRTCEQVKPLTEFYRSSWGKRSQCKPCAVRRSRAWAIANPEKKRLQGRRDVIKRRYGLTVEEYDALINGSPCAICGATEDLCLDHCHVSGDLRGVLCRTCNRGIGLLGDSAKALEQAAKYLGAGHGV